MTSFFSSDDEDSEDQFRENPSPAVPGARPASGAAGVAGPVPAAGGSVQRLSNGRALPARPTERQQQQPPPRPSLGQQAEQPRLSVRKSQAVTHFSDDESSADDESSSHMQELSKSNTDLRRQSQQLQWEVDQLRGQNNTLGSQLEELQEKVEESEQSWSHEQHQRKSQWEDERASLQKENEDLQQAVGDLQMTVREWLPMAYEDSRSRTLSDVLRVVATTRQALQDQSSELVSHSELIARENRRLQGQAKSQEQQLEEQEAALVELREKKDMQTSEQGAERRPPCDFDDLGQSLQQTEESAAQAMEEFLAEKARHERAESVCGRMREELLECEHGHALARNELESRCTAVRSELEGSCVRLEQRLASCQQEEQVQLERLELAQERLQEEMASQRIASSGVESRLRASLQELTAEIADQRASGDSELQRLLENQQQLQDEFTRRRHLEREECQRWEGKYQQLEGSFRESRRQQELECQQLQESFREMTGLQELECQQWEASFRESQRLHVLETQECEELQQQLSSALAECRSQSRKAENRAESHEFKRLRFLCDELDGRLREDEDDRSKAPAAAFAVLARTYAAAARKIESAESPRHAKMALSWVYTAAAQVCSSNPPSEPSSPVRQSEEMGRWHAKEMIEQRMWAEAEVAESRRAVAQLKAELATQEAESVVLPQRGDEQRLRELEARCHSLEEEAKKLHRQLAEKQAQPAAAAEPQSGLSEGRLAAALQRQQACAAWLSSLKAARLELAIPACTEPEQLPALLAGALSEYELEPSDVAVRQQGESLLCTVEVTGNRSLRAVGDALAWAGTSIASEPHVAVKWPLERLQAEIEFEHGYMLTLSQLEKLVPVVAQSYAVYSKALSQVRTHSPKDLEFLEARESMTSFGGSLMSLEEVHRHRLLPDAFRQGTDRMPELRSDAVKAQASLKGKLAPGSSWARLQAEDALPVDDELRRWRSAPDDPMPGGLCLDPGVDGEDQLLERARAHMLPLDHEPAVDALLDASCIEVDFDSPGCLLAGLDWMAANLDVLWIRNGFRDPPCLGYRDVHVGVRQHVPLGAASGQRPHISELHLSLRQLREVREAEGHALESQLASTLLQCGVRQKDVQSVTQIALRVLDTTAGHAAQESLRDLYCTERALELHAGSMTDSTTLLSRELRRQAAAHASAAGVAPEQVSSIQAAAQATARRAREEGGRRRQEGERQVDENAWKVDEILRRQVEELQGHCAKVEGRLQERDRENERLRAEVERLTGLLKPQTPGSQGTTQQPSARDEAEWGLNSVVGSTVELSLAGDTTFRPEQVAAEPMARQEQPQDPDSRSPYSSAVERRRLASLAHNSAAVVARLLKEVRGLGEARAVLEGGKSLDARMQAVQELERHTSRLEQTNHEWASAVANRGVGLGMAIARRDLPPVSLAIDGLSPHADAGNLDGTPPLNGGAFVPSVLNRWQPTAMHPSDQTLQHTAHRLESLHGHLKGLGGGAGEALRDGP